jgi:molybdopterin-guanine dinucleotide biosynthesis protein B
MIPTLSIVGRHDSGKTRLIARVVPLLAERGYRVGTVKHAPHLATIDAADSDSSVHRAAGAARVLLQGEDAAALFWSTPGGGITSPEEIDRWFHGCDLVLIEGMKRGPYPKIEVFRRGREIHREPLAGEIDVVAVVSQDRVALPDGVRLISPRHADAVADLIEEILLGEATGPVS